MDGGAPARQWASATAGVDGRTGNTMARGEAAGKTSVTGATKISTTGEVIIRKCAALAEMQACFALQKEVWKFSDADLVPVRMFVVAAKIGGQVIGAFVHRNDQRNDEGDDEERDDKKDRTGAASRRKVG